MTVVQSLNPEYTYTTCTILAVFKIHKFYFLKRIHEDRLIRFSEGWEWDLTKIRQAYVTDNVIALMADKFINLPEATLQVMKTAACIGITSRIDVLSVVSGKSEQEIYRTLTKVLEEGIVIQVDDRISFVHDRLREAVYSLLDDEEAQKRHYVIGKKLLWNLSFTHRFEIRICTSCHTIYIPGNNRGNNLGHYPGKVSNHIHTYYYSPGSRYHYLYLSNQTSDSLMY